MSVIQRIRDKAAWLIFGAIALAMIGFIVTDAFQGRGSGLFGGHSTTYGKVNGKKIDYIDYQKRLKLVEDQYQGQQNDFMRQRMAENLWTQMVDEILLGKIYSQLGLQITDKEIGDILYGSHPPEQLRQQFTNPETGQYDANMAYQTILDFKKKSPQQYQVFVQSVIESRQREKYLSMVSNTAYAPKWMAEKMAADNSQIANISYVQIPYVTIPDSTVKVTDEEIKEFIAKHAEEYKQEKSRSISYVAFSAAPSTADSASVREKLRNLSAEFASTSDLKGFFIRTTSELPYYEGFISKSRIQVPHKDSILATPVGGVYGPYLDQKNYVLAKIVAQRQSPDTVKVRHILIGTQQQDPQSGQTFRVREDSTAKRIADSIQTAIRNGAIFDSLVVKYSDDQGSRDKGGVYDSIPSGKMVAAFNDFIFGNPVGSKGVVETDFGYHYIEILSQKGSAPAYKIAYLALPIITSSETDNAASGLASQFAAQSRNGKQFDENATKQNLQKLIVSDVRPGDYGVGELGTSRELVRWMYEADRGDVVDQPFSIGDKYIVAQLTEINEEGVMPPQKARPMVEAMVRNHKKAQQILEKIGTPNSLETVASSNKVEVRRADSVSFSSPFIPNVGQELKVIGASFNKQGQGKSSAPIEGTGGVYVLKVEQVYAKPNPNANIENSRNTMEQQLRRQGFQSLESIKKAATIKDYREKF